MRRRARAVSGACALPIVVCALLLGACGGAEETQAPGSAEAAEAPATETAPAPPAPDVPVSDVGEEPPGAPGSEAAPGTRGPATARDGGETPGDADPASSPAAANRGAREGATDMASLGHTSGRDDAPLRIVELSDFACGYCRRFHLETWPTLEREYVDAGKVQWKYVPMELGMFGPNSKDAAFAAECALEQGRFPAMRDVLFERQSEWKSARDAIAIFRRYAGEIGVDVERWRSCMGEGWRIARVDAGTRLSREVGVRGTPTFFIVGYGAVPGALPLDVFREVLDAALADRAGGGEGSGGDGRP